MDIRINAKTADFILLAPLKTNKSEIKIAAVEAEKVSIYDPPISAIW